LSFAGKSLSALADNILFLEDVDTEEQQAFSLTILKMRYSEHDRLPHTYVINEIGISLAQRS
jgi:hypothetical protein